MTRIALISTVPSTPVITGRIIHEISPSTEIVNYLDDGIVPAIAANGNALSIDVNRRLLSLAQAAELSGAQAILLTCSSISEFADVAAPFIKLPIFKIDEPMIRQAVSMGSNIGVVATAETTIPATTRQIESVAKLQGKQIAIQTRLAVGAMDALRAGNIDKHNKLVADTAVELCDICDVVILAQGSMMSALDALDERYHSKVLTSPYSGVKQLFV